MPIFDYQQSPYPIRDDLKDAYRGAWSAIANAGTWWTGAERVAIAAESRAAVGCELCKARKAALSPYAVSGQHDRAPESAGLLSDAAVDVIHRVVTDPARLTKSYVDEAVDSGMSVEQLVELLGVVVATLSIDDFNRALSLDLEPLPEPVAGEPTRYRVPDEQIDPDVAFVPIIKYAGNVGNESDLWTEKTGVTNVMRGLSLVPNAVREWQPLCGAQYIPLDEVHDLESVDTKRAIDRSQIELVAARVSSFNECFY